ncbi:MAG: hypothetical protein M1834_006294 [Cirrosporium novae-zelandiae]|nr:MAG: hypothetical protein M1834_006294 [Cirrosporium novae-zelandiae]
MSSQSVQASEKVFLLPLKDNGTPDLPSDYVYLPPPTNPPYKIRFAIEGTSSICRQGTLRCNIPAVGEEFVRTNYKEYKLVPDFNRVINVDIAVPIAGAFSYEIVYHPLPKFSSSSVPTPQPTRTPVQYIDVQPSLTLGKTPLPLDALSCFSVISKFLGEYPQDWSKHLLGISARGYNMVHFTPLMQRGASNSPYSIYDQLEFDRTMFPNGEEDVAHMVSEMEEEYELLGMTDVVWNHTADNSKWLEDHPEAGYNVETAPWLESALDLDTALLEYSEKLEKLGLPTDFQAVDDLLRVMEDMKQHVICKIKLWEFYVIDVPKTAKLITEAWENGKARFPERGVGGAGVTALKDAPLKQKAEFLADNGMINAGKILGRFGRSIDSEIGAALLTVMYGRYNPDASSGPRPSAVHSSIVKILDECNLIHYREYDSEVSVAMDQLFNRIKYLRIDDHGPKLGPVTKENPLIEPYFTRLPHNETTKKHNSKSLALVNNGWVWAADAMRDNAGPDSRAYLRREVIVWGDCVKLRYGNCPDDNPYLWDRMAKYTRLMAKHFNGFRIDNCHSTPIHLAEYMLDQARKVRPNLCVFAELFSGSEEMDYKFVKRLSLSALIREAMQAWSTQELSRLVHRHGGRPIGSFELDVPSSDNKSSTVANGASDVPGPKEFIHHIRTSPLHALFMDCTHDNETPAQKRDARDTLPNAALVSMCASAIGSVMGYDEIYPKLIDLVGEKRMYSSPYSEKGVQTTAGEGGIGGVKKLLNSIHTLMGKDGYDETHIHHEGEYITVHRVHPNSRKGFFLIAHTAFPGYGNGNGVLSPVHLTGTKAKSLGSWMLEVDTSATASILGDKDVIRGLPSQVIDLQNDNIETKGNDTMISIPERFPPGSIALFETWIPSAEHEDGLSKFITSGAKEAVSDLDLIDLNTFMYRSEPEERDASGGRDGVYNIPNHGALVYAGLQGWWSVLKNIVKYNDLGHPLCNHLREGQWVLDYIVARLERAVKDDGYERLEKPVIWLRQRFDAVRSLPSFLLPRCFAIIVQTIFDAAWHQGISCMNENVQKGQDFFQRLAMVSVQETGYMRNTSLYPTKQVPSLAAGLPHFASDWARCWGRDVFISLRGLYLGTGRFDDAKEHIKAFATVLKHGMIPNLLGSGKEPRFNSRDSPWFFLQNIQDYTKIAPNGIKILQEKVSRRFLPYDDTWFPVDDPQAYSHTSTIEDIVQEVLQRHASGLHFREANAGPGLDSQMKAEGFNIDVEPDWDTGIIFGGNQWNCGTWMDKMGESEKAGSKGFPGTPRDGAAVEITGMVYSACAWVASLNDKGQYKYSGVETNKNGFISFTDWAKKIKANFERCYWIPIKPSEDQDYDVNSRIINRRGIYKDLYKSGKEYEDYQLRPNFSVAMCVAPDLFTPEHALHALEMADSILRGPTGMATLDPKDLNYRPYYINSEDSTDFATSKGRNYHQGPEWLWPTGFFLRALLKFDLMRRKTKEERTESFQQVTRRLEGCKKMIKDTPWAGLTELTNKDGSFCDDSCPTQSWSASCLVDLFYDAGELSIE